jgi:phosphatidylglycerophosphate synthase
MYARLRRLKFVLDGLFRPALVFLHGVGLRPLHLTLVSLLFGFLGAFFFFERPPFGLFFLALWFVFDVLDGMLARVCRCESAFGAWVDFLVDRLVLIMVLYRYYEFNPGSSFTVLACLLVVLVLSLGEFFRR